MKKFLIFTIIMATMASCFSSQYTCPTYAGSSHNGKTFHSGVPYKK